MMIGEELEFFTKNRPWRLQALGAFLFPTIQRLCPRPSEPRHNWPRGSTIRGSVSNRPRGGIPHGLHDYWKEKHRKKHDTSTYTSATYAFTRKLSDKNVIFLLASSAGLCNGMCTLTKQFHPGGYPGGLSGGLET